MAGVLACGGDPEGTATRSQFEADGLAWPLTEDRVVLDCEDGAVSVRTNDGFYAVNGLAQSKGFPPLEDSHLEGPKVPLTDLTNAGLALCP